MVRIENREKRRREGGKEGRRKERDILAAVVRQPFDFAASGALQRLFDGDCGRNRQRKQAEHWVECTHDETGFALRQM
jgi:hypothetical protein